MGHDANSGLSGPLSHVDDAITKALDAAYDARQNGRTNSYNYGTDNADGWLSHVDRLLGFREILLKQSPRITPLTYSNEAANVKVQVED